MRRSGAHPLEIELGDDEPMQIRHHAVYQARYVEVRGALKRELVMVLRVERISSV